MQIFQAQPALAYAIFQGLLNMKLVDPNMVQELMNQQRLDSSNTASQEAESPMHKVSSPPAPVAPPVHAPQQPAMDEQQRIAIAQIMSLTDEQINSLPEQQRQQILVVRDQVRRQQQS